MGSKKSKYVGVSYNTISSKWRAKRRNKIEKKKMYNGYYKDEETAAHASDTLARKLMKSGEHNLKLNFPDDQKEVHWKTKVNNRFIGVSYDKNRSKWRAQRWSKNENTNVCNGYYTNEERAA